jgi:hypothetical protein
MNDKFFWLKSDGSVEEIDYDKYSKLMRGDGHKLLRCYASYVHITDSSNNSFSSTILQKEQLRLILGD